MHSTSLPILQCLLIGGLVPIACMGMSSVARADQDIVIIGETATQRQQFQSYWQQLLILNQTAERNRPQRTAPPQYAVREKQLDQLVKNLFVTDMGLDYIIQLNGSSQVSGILTNGNDVSVTIIAVNYQVLDQWGGLLQTGSAQPKPSTIAPGQSVTFADTLWTIPPDSNYKVQLLDPPFVLSPSFE